MPEISGSLFFLGEGDENVTLQCNATTSITIQDSDFGWVRVEDLDVLEMLGSTACSDDMGSGLVGNNAMEGSGGLSLIDSMDLIRNGSSFTVQAALYESGGYFVCVIRSETHGNCSSNYSTVAG